MEKKMKKLRVFTLCIVLLSILIITACDLSDTSETFEYRLQGGWESNASPYYYYISSLVITSNTITIIGYDYGYDNDPSLPFSKFTKNVPLKGYSEKLDNYNGLIYIEEFGVLHEGIPYQYESNSTYDSFEKLRFVFPSPDEPSRQVNLIKVDE
jgi:hypothetical protein